MRAIRAVVLAVLAVAFAADAHAFTVRGTVTNGTTGKPVATAHVIVLRPSAGMQPVATTEVADGIFEIPNLAGDAPIYVLRVEYAGATYNEPVHVTGQDQNVDVIVYENTTSWDGISVAIPHLAAARTGNELVIEQMYEITNAGSPPRTLSTPDGAFRFFLPADMDSLLECSVSTGEMPLKLSPIPTDKPDLYSIAYPIRPGVTQLSVMYTVPYSSGSYTMKHRFTRPVSHMSVFAVDSTMRVTSTSHQFASTESVHGMTAYAVHDIKANTTVELTFSGGDPNFAGLDVDEGGNAGGGTMGEAQGTITARAGDDEKIAYFLMITVLLVLAGVTGMSLRDRQDPLSDPQVLRAHYDLLLARLARLDDLHAANTIPNDAYRASREELLGRLAALAMQLRTQGSVHGPDRPATPPASSQVQ